MPKKIILVLFLSVLFLIKELPAIETNDKNSLIKIGMFPFGYYIKYNESKGELNRLGPALALSYEYFLSTGISIDFSFSSNISPFALDKIDRNPSLRFSILLQHHFVPNYFLDPFIGFGLNYSQYYHSYHNFSSGLGFNLKGGCNIFLYKSFLLGANMFFTYTYYKQKKINNDIPRTYPSFDILEVGLYFYFGIRL